MGTDDTAKNMYKTSIYFFRSYLGIFRSFQRAFWILCAHFISGLRWNSHDGVEGTLTRIKAAQQFVVEFGVATECGLGRRPPDTIPALLRIHSQVAEPVSG